MPVHPRAYVRPAKASEASLIIDLLTRAFINDPTMCFYGVVPALVKDPTNPTRSEEKIINSLRVFQAAMLKTPSLAGAKVDVVVIPHEADGEGANHNGETKEEIIGVATWLPPNVTLDFNFTTTLRGGALRVAFAWGLTSVKVK